MTSRLLETLKGAPAKAGVPSAAQDAADAELNDELTKAVKDADAKALRRILRKLRELDDDE